MNKSILVTGAGRSLGYELAKLHAEAGDTVYALEYDPTPELKALAAQYTGNVFAYTCDISSTADVNAACADAVKAGKKLDVVYNVAGIYLFDITKKTGLAETDLDGGLRMLDVNGVGLLRVCKAVLPLIGKGTVVLCVTSEAGSITVCYRKAEYLYSMSKAAANMAAKILSNELHDIGARVICVHPGWLRSRMGGPEAAKSPNGVDPDKSAADIKGIVDRVDEIPESWMFMEHNGRLLPW